MVRAVVPNIKPFFASDSVLVEFRVQVTPRLGAKTRHSKLLVGRQLYKLSASYTTCSLHKSIEYSNIIVLWGH
jgi:hypothetical protein